MRTRSLALVAAVFGPNGIGFDEAALTVALSLIARGLWLTWQPGAYLIPGIVLLWIVLPSRAAFIAKAPNDAAKPRGERAI